jgi:hypothetical protein
MWLFYPPLVGYIIWLGIKHRSLTLFTACNPGLPGGGFVGESKSDILHRVAAVCDAVPSFTLIRADMDSPIKHELAAAHVAAHGFPVVVKPDQGQRGAGVVIARTKEALSDALARCTVDLMLQRYVPGEEFGIFYYRRPGNDRGHIFALTEKRLPVVVGDGCRTLERLILDDERAVAVASLYVRLNNDRLNTVPSAGTAVRLSELGVHSRGAIFLDGARLLTRALQEATDRIGSKVDGFSFGRFDVRAESVEAFTAGRFSIIELNGVTSEATSIYDPRHSVFDAHRILRAQWRLAFEIGSDHRARGIRPTTIRELLAFMRAYSVTSRGHLQAASATSATGVQSASARSAEDAPAA